MSEPMRVYGIRVTIMHMHFPARISLGANWGQECCQTVMIWYLSMHSRAAAALALA